MCLNIYVINTDERQKYLSESLNGIKKGSTAIDTIKEAANNWYVLPTPLYKYDFDIVDEDLKRRLSDDNTLVFAGAVKGKWQTFFEQNNIEYYDFMVDDAVMWQNADVTAEATIMIYLANSRYAVRGQKIIVSGYGRCGQLIAEKFAALGANVTIMARSREARKSARNAGCNAIPFSYGPQEAYATVALINTVPQKVIGKCILSELQKDCLLIEIASTPGGFDMEMVNKYGVRYINAPGLPSKYLQKTSGMILANCINGFVKTRFENGVENIWIYQVSP